MAQFDVHRNRGESRLRFPLLVIVQSSMLRAWDRRVVVPLAPTAPMLDIVDRRLNPVLTIEGATYHVAAHEIANVPKAALGDLVANVREHAELIVGAIDWLINQGHG